MAVVHRGVYDDIDMI